MNYEKQYTQLVQSRQLLKSTRLQEKQNGGYFEVHHILPKSMGGNNEQSNLVILTPREHFVAHVLLWKIHRSPEMAYAVQRFTQMKDRRKFSSRVYERIRKIAAFKGKPHTEEAKEKIRQGKIGSKNPMFGLGKDHPNYKRTGHNNPNFNQDPWKNAKVTSNPKMVELWNNREQYFKLWLELDEPHWYSFGKAALEQTPNAELYNPRHFSNMVKWFNGRL